MSSARSASRLSRPAAPVTGTGRSAVPSYKAIYGSTATERVGMVKQRLPAVWAKQVISDLRLPVASANTALHVSTSTLNRKAKNDELLSQAESERVLGLAKLIGQVQTLVEESGEADGFDARAWTARWLSEPLPAFGGRRPIDYLDTMEGQALVGGALAVIAAGSYA